MVVVELTHVGERGVEIIGDDIVQEAVVSGDHLRLAVCGIAEGVVVGTDDQTCAVARRLAAPQCLSVLDRTVLVENPLTPLSVVDVTSEVAGCGVRAHRTLPADVVGNDIIHFREVLGNDQLFRVFFGEVQEVARRSVVGVAGADGEVNVNSQLVALTDQVEHVVGIRALCVNEDGDRVHAQILDAEQVVVNDLGIVCRGVDVMLKGASDVRDGGSVGNAVGGHIVDAEEVDDLAVLLEVAVLFVDVVAIGFRLGRPEHDVVLDAVNDPTVDLQRDHYVIGSAARQIVVVEGLADVVGLFDQLADGGIHLLDALAVAVQLNVHHDVFRGADAGKVHISAACGNALRIRRDVGVLGGTALRQVSGKHHGVHDLADKGDAGSVVEVIGNRGDAADDRALHRPVVVRSAGEQRHPCQVAGVQTLGVLDFHERNEAVGAQLAIAGALTTRVT